MNDDSVRWLRAREIFAGAVDLLVEERTPFLERECSDDAGLRTEVEELLAHDAAAPADFVAPPPSRGIATGRRLGEFELVHEIGRGSMGVVYRVRQPSLGREVAVKVLVTGLTTSEVQIERFHREARAAAKLDHEHVVRVITDGVERDAHWFAMELVPGHDLHHEIRLQRGEPDAVGTALLPPPGDARHVAAVARLVADAADALAHAHAHGVIHRDVKPSNLLLTPEGRVKVVDFGIARDETAGTMTRSDQVLGSLPYVSPEQARLLEAEVDQRSDVYSLGIVLYELLTLEKPFPGSTSQEVIARIGVHEPRPIRAHNERVPRDLATICEKAMSKEPRGRYASASAYADDLRRFLRLEAIEARPPSASAKLRRWTRRRRGELVAAGALTLVAFVAWGLAGRQARSTRLRLSRTAVDLALSIEDWDGALPAVVDARRALEDAEASGLESPALALAALRFRARYDEDHAQRVGTIRSLMEQANRAPGAPERARALFAAVAAAGRAALIHDADEWLRDTARVETLYPRVTLEVAPSTPADGARASYRAVDPVSGDVGPAVPLGELPIVDAPLPPGDYRFVVESRDGRRAELLEHCSVPRERYALAARLLDPARVLRGMVRVEGGRFALQDPRPLGCTRARDVVTIESFYLDETEVSNREYLDFLSSTGRAAPSVWREAGYDGHDWRSLPVDALEDRWLDLPVVGASWEDAQAYARWMGKRLPTHLELEWALRGPELLERPWGDGADRGGVRANVDGPGRRAARSWREAYRAAIGALLPVAEEGYRQPPNGLFHGFGNAEEWTASKVVEVIAGRPQVRELDRYFMGCAFDATTDEDTLGDHAYSGIGDAHASHRVGFRCASSAD